MLQGKLNEKNTVMTRSKSSYYLDQLMICLLPTCAFLEWGGIKLWTEQSKFWEYSCVLWWITRYVRIHLTPAVSTHPHPTPRFQVSARSQTLCYQNKNSAWSSNLRTLNSDFASQQMHSQLISVGRMNVKLWNGILYIQTFIWDRFFWHSNTNTLLL